MRAHPAWSYGSAAHLQGTALWPLAAVPFRRAAHLGREQSMPDWAACPASMCSSVLPAYRRMPCGLDPMASRSSGRSLAPLQAAHSSGKQPQHCTAGWCSACHAVVEAPSAGPADVLGAVAGLAAGGLSMPGGTLGSAGGGGGGDSWQDPAISIGGAFVEVPSPGQGQVGQSLVPACGHCGANRGAFCPACEEAEVHVHAMRHGPPPSPARLSARPPARPSAQQQTLLSRLPVDVEQGVRLARLLCLVVSSHPA